MRPEGKYIDIIRVIIQRRQKTSQKRHLNVICYHFVVSVELATRKSNYLMNYCFLIDSFIECCHFVNVSSLALRQLSLFKLYLGVCINLSNYIHLKNVV